MKIINTVVYGFISVMGLLFIFDPDGHIIDRIRELVN